MRRGGRVQNGSKQAPTKTPQVRAIYPGPMGSRGTRQLRANAIVLAVLIVGVLAIRCAMDPAVDMGREVEEGEAPSAGPLLRPTLTGHEPRDDARLRAEGSASHEAEPEEDGVAALGLPTELPWDLDVRVNELGVPVAGVRIELLWMRAPLPWDMGPTWRGRPLATGVSDATGQVRWRDLQVPGPPRSRVSSASLALVATSPWHGLTLLARPGDAAWRGRSEAGSVRFQEEDNPPRLVGQAGLGVERLVATPGRLVAGGVGLADVRVMTGRPAASPWTTTDDEGRFVLEAPEDGLEVVSEVVGGLVPGRRDDATSALGAAPIDVEHVPVGWVRVTLAGTSAAPFPAGGLWLIEAGKDLAVAHAIQKSSSSFPLPPLGLAPRDHEGDTWRWRVAADVTYDLWVETAYADGRRLARGLVAGRELDVPWPEDLVIHELQVRASPDGAPIEARVQVVPGFVLNGSAHGSAVTVIAARDEEVQVDVRAEGYARGHATLSARDGVIVQRHDVRLEPTAGGVETRFVLVDRSGRLAPDDMDPRYLPDPPVLIDDEGHSPQLPWRLEADGTWRAAVPPGSWNVRIGPPLGVPVRRGWAFVEPVDQRVDVTTEPQDVAIELRVAGRVRVTCFGDQEGAQGHRLRFVELMPRGWRPTEPLVLGGLIKIDDTWPVDTFGVGHDVVSDLLEPGPYVLKLRVVDEQGAAVAGGDIERELDVRAAEWTEVRVTVP